MRDLVQLMTQTLRLEAKESCEDLHVPNPGSEFRLHRKYRDTLVLHGKAAEEGEPPCVELPPGEWFVLSQGQSRHRVDSKAHTCKLFALFIWMLPKRCIL